MMKNGLHRILVLVAAGIVLLVKLSNDITMQQVALHNDIRLLRQQQTDSRRLELVRVSSKPAKAIVATEAPAATAEVVAPKVADAATPASHTTLPPKSKYAYSFVIGGCNPNKPAYKGFMYNILVATRLLREVGSTADVVAFFQLSYEYHDAEVLPAEDVKALEGLGIRIMYIPQSQHESFYETVLNKFRILELTEYRRVLLMDGDVMPVSNLDYLFELSDDNKHGPGNSTLKQNVVVSGPWEPANAGFFMLAPGEGEYDHINQIIDTRQKKASAIEKGVKFNETDGWGHVIEAPDQWVARKETGRNWNFHFAFSDQGLLYHWTKYVKQDVSIVFDGKVENWSAGKDGQAQLEATLEKPFKDRSKLLIKQYAACRKFMCDYLHFSGKGKPWMSKRGPPPNLSDKAIPTKEGANVWWYFLKLVDKEQKMGIDFDNWTVYRPPFGLYATTRDMDRNMEKSRM